MRGSYQPNVRALWKIKHERTADVVVAGYRLHKTSTPEQPLLGSLLLGLYAEGRLQHVGVSAAFPAARRAELITELEPLLVDPADHPWAEWAMAEAHEGARLPGAQSRWNAKKDLSWIPLDPVLVAEVGYDHMEGTRFRHTTQFKRWRPDRDPSSCTYEQLEEPVSYDLDGILS
jgi:ATP-dependent DNA ligase